jgi:hypothetical protein
LTNNGARHKYLLCGKKAPGKKQNNLKIQKAHLGYFLILNKQNPHNGSDGPNEIIE